MNAFRILLALMWIAVAVISFQAFAQQGMVAGELFFADIREASWRGQFNADFMGHLMIVGLWVAWRHRFSPAGWILGVLCVLGGGLASFLYLLVVSLQVKGDTAKLLLGNRR